MLQLDTNERTALRRLLRRGTRSQNLAFNYIPEAKKWQIVERTGEIKRTQDYPIPAIFPKESGKGLWGGEGVVKGFKMSKSRYMGRVPHYWWPTLRKEVFYSEILDKYMSITCTERTLTLVDEMKGFDNYILKTTPCNLKSQLGMDLKRKMILTLIRREMYPDDPDKQQEIYEKYKEFVIPENEAEWLGLSLSAAFRKQQEIDKIKEKCPPLKMQYRLQLINQLKESQNDELKRKELENTRSRMGWLAKLNPFQKTESTPVN